MFSVSFMSSHFTMETQSASEGGKIKEQSCENKIRGEERPEIREKMELDLSLMIIYSFGVKYYAYSLCL